MQLVISGWFKVSAGGGMKEIDYGARFGVEGWLFGGEFIYVY